MALDPSVRDDVRQHYLFAGLDAAAFDRIADAATTRRLAKSEILFQQGDAADSFCFVVRGIVELGLISSTGEKKTLEVVGPGRTFAEAIAFMREKKYPVTASALEDAMLCIIPNDVYRDVLYGDPDACMRLLADISMHLRARVREIEHLTVQNARSRLVSYLIDHIAETDDDSATVRLALPRHVIASRLSIQPETLSRLFRNLADEGLISVEDRVVFIHRLSALRLYD